MNLEQEHKTEPEHEPDPRGTAKLENQQELAQILIAISTNQELTQLLQLDHPY